MDPVNARGPELVPAKGTRKTSLQKKGAKAKKNSVGLAKRRDGSKHLQPAAKEKPKRGDAERGWAPTKRVTRKSVASRPPPGTDKKKGWGQLVITKRKGTKKDGLVVLLKAGKKEKGDKQQEGDVIWRGHRKSSGGKGVNKEKVLPKGGREKDFRSPKDASEKGSLLKKRGGGGKELSEASNKRSSQGGKRTSIALRVMEEMSGPAKRGKNERGKKKKKIGYDRGGRSEQGKKNQKDVAQLEKVLMGGEDPRKKQTWPAGRTEGTASKEGGRGGLLASV